MWRVMLKRKDNMAEIICAFISRHDPANATIHQNTQKKKIPWTSERSEMFTVYQQNKLYPSHTSLGLHVSTF